MKLFSALTVTLGISMATEPEAQAKSVDVAKIASTDKAAHFGISSVTVEIVIKGCPLMIQKPNFWNCHTPASLGVLALGVFKEYSDQRAGRKFDNLDLVADTLGIITGNLLQWRF